MPSQEVRVQARVHAPIEKVFAFFADHERFATLLGGRCTRIKDGQGDPNGLGSVRSIGPGPLAFEETIVTFEPNQRIEYTVTRGSPIKNHLGTIDFHAEDDVTVVDYVIRFDGKLPFTGPLIAAALRAAWNRSSPRVLAQLER
ncbi:SRPBCC family protein [Fontimonas sp. SYSU GA230001]|uniref:SRPBCC family protein n=1 Tax=Fontimonas sp. SYSU GA230001 TaxID=3142450 RepID=UPI0032B53F49